jgi:thymidylate kinase
MKATGEVKSVEFWDGNLLGNTVAILISGKAGTGKSTFGSLVKKALQEEGYTTTTIPFADNVKYVAKEAFGWDGEKDDKGRQLLQGIGNLGRQYDENLWVDRVIEMAEVTDTIIPVEFIICDDWRFPNEAKRMAERFTTILVKVEAKEREALKGTEFYDDVSEVSLDAYEDYYYVVSNESTLEELKNKANSIVSSILGKE